MENHGTKTEKKKWAEFRNSTTKKTARDRTGPSIAHSVWIASTHDQWAKTIHNVRRTESTGDRKQQSHVLTESDHIKRFDYSGYILVRS